MSTSEAPARGTSPVLPGWGRVQVHPGTGVVDHHGDALLVMPSYDATNRWTRDLLAICRKPSGDTGSGQLRAVAALLEGADPEEVPAFALLVRTDDALGLVVHGPVVVRVDGVLVDTRPPPGSPVGVERMVDGVEWDEVSVGASGPAGALATEPATEPAGDLPFDLEAGTVPGGGVTVHRGGPPAVADRGSTVLRPAVQFKSVRLAHGSRPDPVGRPRLPVATAPEPSRPAEAAGQAVLVEGVLCANGHFVDPEQESCPTCGAGLGAASRVVRPRPPLGILVTDGGSIYTVASDYVIGREPGQSPLVSSGKAQPLVLRDTDRSTSRVHAQLELSGWKVRIRDNHSANGTFVSSKGAAGPWVPVPADPPLNLFPGDRVRLGKRQLLFEGYRETAVGPAGR